jgi:hypothetical protein
MRTWAILAAVGFIFAADRPLQPARADEPRPVGPPISLFNGKTLEGWTIYVDPNPARYSPDSNPQNVFKAEGGLIHVSGERFACLSTQKEFENYRLTVEFRWGKKRWPPRANDKRDSGILLHCTGPDKIWTKSIECQIQEHDCGDFWLVEGTSITVDGQVQRGHKPKKTDGEKPFGEWNRIEVICLGDKVTNIVNGVVVNEGTGASVTKGRITLQSEGAEVYYRKVEIQPLEAGTAESK